MAGNTPETIRGRISEAERLAMLDRLDAAESSAPQKQKRSMPRVVFRKNDVAVRVYHPGGSTSAGFVTTRDLSAGGVSFLYNGFLHKNTKIEIVLRRRLGGNDLIQGTVIKCELAKSAQHNIGVKFDHKIFPKLYIDPSEWGELDDGTPVDTSKLTGTILHLDDQDMDRMLLAHFTKGTQIKLTSVGTIEQAVAKIKSERFDCVLCDLMLDNGATGEQAIVEFRSAGFAGPVAMVTAETSPARLKVAQDAGASAVITKPYDANKLLSLLSSWLTAGAPTEESIFSTLGNQEHMLPMIEQYVNKVRGLLPEMRKQLDAENVEGMRNICQIIKGTGIGFGFQQLSDAARETVQSLDSTASIQDSMMLLQRLESICRRIAPGRKMV